MIKKYKKIVIAAIIIIGAIGGMFAVYKFYNSKKHNINLLQEYRKTHTPQETLDKFNEIYPLDDKKRYDESKEVLEEVLGDDFRAAQAEEDQVKQEQQSIQDDMKKIKITNVKTEGNKVMINVENPTNRNIRYIEFRIDGRDKNKNVISSEMANDTSIFANSKKYVTTYVNFPNNVNNITTYVAKVQFE